jgi:hypothetical protein
MKRLMKILLGLSIGAAVAMLFAPKSGRELRERLIGGATSKLLPAAPIEFPEPDGERFWDAGPATAVAEPPVEEVVVEETVVIVDEAGVVEEVALVEEVTVVEEVAAAEPEAVEDTASDDLRRRIEETRAAVETDISQPFAPAVAEEAVVEQTAVEEVTAEEPVAEEAVVDEPVVDEPVVDEPVVEEPVLEGPAFREPDAAPEPDVVVEVPVEEPRAWEIAYDEREAPAVEQPPAEMPIAEEPVSEEPAAEPVVAEEAAVEVVAEAQTPEPVADETVDEVIEAPVADEAVADEPVGEEPVVEEPAVDEPAAREGGPIDQAEMRRRIEETRARLKAKAFDAMMSGESALLSRDSGAKPVPTGDDVKLDGELESTIDESLSQEEY